MSRVELTETRTACAGAQPAVVRFRPEADGRGLAIRISVKRKFGHHVEHAYRYMHRVIANSVSSASVLSDENEFARIIFRGEFIHKRGSLATQ